ncbi:MAG: plastocyanin/azurin family copper-binding protein [Halolamina sp.]|uniref:plastocyanin/azurin family copper-binding protein n=1 Tax=Halolamina sp. TaxID=1940283 RepID=UPI002FC2CB32
MTRTTPPTRRSLLRKSGAALAALSTAGCLGGDTEKNEFDGPVVIVGPNARNVFSPGTDEPLTIEAGTRVQWDWRSANHNIRVDEQPDAADWQGTEGSAIYHSGHTHEHTFEVTGEYHYVCVPHEGLGMVADLVVE